MTDLAGMAGARLLPSGFKCSNVVSGLSYGQSPGNSRIPAWSRLPGALPRRYGRDRAYGIV